MKGNGKAGLSNASKQLKYLYCDKQYKIKSMHF